MHVGVVHNTKSGSLSVSRISIEYDPATGKQIEENTEDDYVIVDIYPEAIKGRLENIAKGKYDGCEGKMVTRVILKNPQHEHLGSLYKDGDLLCLHHNLEEGHGHHHENDHDHHHDHDEGGQHVHKHAHPHTEEDEIDRLEHGAELDPGYIGGLLGNLHDLKQFD